MNPDEFQNELHRNVGSGSSQGRDISRSSYFRTEFADSEVEDSQSALGAPYASQVRNIVGQEDSAPKERKKWSRPPLVGQASTSSESSIPLQSNNEESSSSGSEEGTQPQSKQLLSSERFIKRSDYICEKPPEGGSNLTPESAPENNEVHRLHSPSEASASSLTSVRPLEWDSGADVGYFQYNSNHPAGDGNLSSIERLALARGTAVLFTRSDPEGTTSTVKQTNQIVRIIGIPDASSTPLNTFSIIKTASSSLLQASSRGTSTTESDSPQQPHLFPEVHILNDGPLNDSSSVNSKPSSPIPDNPTFNKTSPKKLSASLENIKDKIDSLAQPSTFPRSQSQSCLQSSFVAHSNLQRILNVAQSHSSSSVSTVITKTSSPKKNNIVVQTQKPRCSIGTQLSRHVQGQSLNENNETGSQKRESNECQPSNFEMSSEDRAHSFEYLPGHMYENNICHVEDSSSDATSHTSHHTIGSEIDKGVALLAEFMKSSKANDRKSKKKLLKRVVERLINSECSQDDVSLGLSSEHNYSDYKQPNPEVKNEIHRPGEVRNKCVGTCNNGESIPNEGSSLSTVSHSATNSSSGATFFSSGSSKVHYSSCDRIFVGTSENPQEENRKFSDWKKPATRAEKIYEQKKKKGSKSASEVKLLEYLSTERENQLEWIKSEINHLSNLKSLLEEHRALKKNLSGIKYSKTKQALGRSSRSAPAQSRTHSRPQTSEKQKNFGRSQPEETSEASHDSGWDSHLAHPSQPLSQYRRPTIPAAKPSVSQTASSTIPDKSTSKGSLAYTITFSQSGSKDKENILKEVPTRESGSESPICLIADRNVLRKESRQRVAELYQQHKTLQDELLSKRPDYVLRAENRRQMVAEITALRELRQNNRKKIIASAIEPERECDANIPPNPLTVRRIFNQKDMRKQTEQKYKQTAEVKNMKEEMKKQETYRTNRLMAEIFKKKLQKKALRGEVNLSNSVNVISTV